jgi:hypothetical protein
MTNADSAMWSAALSITAFLVAAVADLFDPNPVYHFAAIFSGVLAVMATAIAAALLADEHRRGQ